MTSECVFEREFAPVNQDQVRTSERRGSKRFAIRAPLTVLAASREIPAFTRDLSGRGVYFCVSASDSALLGREFEFMIELPPEVTFTSSCKIKCQGRVVRTETTALNEAGFAVEIQDYSILR